MLLENLMTTRTGLNLHSSNNKPLESIQLAKLSSNKTSNPLTFPSLQMVTLLSVNHISWNVAKTVMSTIPI
jgi:hypothetical protein